MKVTVDGGSDFREELGINRTHVIFESFRDAFKFLRGQGKLLVILDDFPYLIGADKGVTLFLSRARPLGRGEGQSESVKKVEIIQTIGNSN